MQNQKKMNDFIDKKIQEYVEISSQSEPELLKKLTKETHLKVLHPRMLCSPYQGRLLSLISKIHNPSSVLEIGTYTGYSTLCIAEGLKKNGTIFTIDCNEELLKIQNNYFERSEYRQNIVQHTGKALEIIPKINSFFDLVYLDADKENYINYFNLIIDKLNPGGLILSDNVLWSGKVVDKKTSFDYVTKKVFEFNETIKNDLRIDTLVLPIRDGITISRKN
tara:strand:- start:2127 stop:2789 length:663 start_codon:yes stop_codon:yes gene_type:complete